MVRHQHLMPQVKIYMGVGATIDYVQDVGWWPQKAMGVMVHSREQITPEEAFEAASRVLGKNLKRPGGLKGPMLLRVAHSPDDWPSWLKATSEHIPGVSLRIDFASSSSGRKRLPCRSPAGPPTPTTANIASSLRRLSQSADVMASRFF
jgi:hypothetical protein